LEIKKIGTLIVLINTNGVSLLLIILNFYWLEWRLFGVMSAFLVGIASNAICYTIVLYKTDWEKKTKEIVSQVKKKGNRIARSTKLQMKYFIDYYVHISLLYF